MLRVTHSNWVSDFCLQGDDQLELSKSGLRLLRHIQTILAVEELYDGLIGIADCVVVIDFDAFEMLDQTSLQISRS